MKRAVHEALLHMGHLLLDLPYTPPPVSLDDVGDVCDTISISIYEFQVTRIRELAERALADCTGPKCFSEQHKIARQILDILGANRGPKIGG